jgi:Mg-chelatase subunit ChlD
MQATIVGKQHSWAAALGILACSLLRCAGSPDEVGAGGRARSGGGADDPQVVIVLPDAGTSGAAGAPGPAPSSDANCGQQISTASKGQTDVLLVLDRSGSMNESIAAECCCSSACRTAINIKLCPDTANCSERWPALSSAVSATLASTAGLRWGVKLFSSPHSPDVCGVDPGVEVPVGASPSQVQAQISGANPLNATPTAKAVIAATAYLKTVTDPDDKVILLATDGEPNCKSGSSATNTPDVDNTQAAIQAALRAGFRVYVIGIGPSVGNLDGFARAGGTEHYYPATSPAQLSSALASISKTVASCTFALATPPPDPDNIAVYVDNNLVGKDAANGWGFGATPMTILLHGATCDQITSGAATTVRVLFGCPGETPPPTLIP